MAVRAEESKLHSQQLNLASDGGVILVLFSHGAAAHFWVSLHLLQEGIVLLYGE